MSKLETANADSSAQLVKFQVCPRFVGMRSGGVQHPVSRQIWNNALAGLVALLLSTHWAGAVVYQGTITNWHESSGVRRIGAEGKFVDLYWSIATVQGTNSTGWFYGSFLSFNTDVAHAAGITNVSQITNAGVFPFQTLSAGPFGSGTLLVWSNKYSGHFGVLRVDSITNLSLNGTWWFQADGRGDFSSPAVPVPISGNSPAVIAVLPATQLEFYSASQRTYRIQLGGTLGNWTYTGFGATNVTSKQQMSLSRRGEDQAFYRVVFSNLAANPSADVTFYGEPQPNPIGGTNRISLMFRYRQALWNPFQSVSIASVSLYDARLSFYKNVGFAFFMCYGVSSGCSPLAVASSFADGTWIKLSWEVINLGGQFSVLNGRATITTHGTNDSPSAPGIVLQDQEAFPVTNVGYSQSPIITASFKVQEWGGVDLRTVTVKVNDITFDSLLAPRLFMKESREVVWTTGEAGSYALEYRPDPAQNVWHFVDWVPGGLVTNYTPLTDITTTNLARFRVTLQ